MMEATNRNLLFRLLIIYFIISIILWPKSICAQTTADSRLTQLLDSAEILKLKSNFIEANAICDQTKTEANKINDWEGLARALNELAEINRYYDEFEVCQKLLDQSRDIIRTNLDTTHVEMARNFFYQGKLQRFMADEGNGYPDNVFASYHKAEGILKKLGNHPKELSLVILDLGRFYETNNKIALAKTYFNELDILLNGDFEQLDYIRGFCLYYLGEFYNSIADYERAILYMSLARYIFRHPSSLDNIRLLKAEINLGNFYFNTDQFQSAILHYLKGIEIAEKNQIHNYSEVLSANANLGRAYYEVNIVDSSFLFSKRALSLNRKQSRVDNLAQSRILLNLGLAYSLKGNYKSSEDYFDEALKLIIETDGEKGYYPHVFYRNIGDYYKKRKQFDIALENYQDALIALFPGFNSQNIYADPDYNTYEKKEDVLYVLTEKAGALYIRYLHQQDIEDLKSAFKLYIILYKLLNELLNTGMMDESMIQVFQGFKDAFNLSIECAFDLYDETDNPKYLHQAFQFIEKSRYFLLQKVLTNALYKKNAGISDELFNQERQLNHDVNDLKYKIVTVSDEAEKFSLRNSLYDKLISKKAIWESIDKFSSTEAPFFMDSLLLSVDDIQNNLVKENEIIVEYHWAKNYIFALTFTNKNLYLNIIEITPQLIKQLNIYSKCVSGESEEFYTPEEIQKYISSSHILYQRIIEPVLQNIDNWENSLEGITIVPDGQLSYLPFEALLTEDPSTNVVGYWNLPYLLKKTRISYAYSLNILKSNLNSVQKIKKPGLLAFSYSAEVDEDLDFAHLRAEDEIRFSAEELNSIKKYIKRGSFNEDTLASEALFKREATNYSLLHLALHGQADVTDRYNSKLLFKDDSTTGEDGELHAYELYNMDLSNTEMAVLSACETGIGMQTEGEGIFSIARGFAYAGCPSILMSLWKVSDKTTAEIMGYFYQNLVKGMQKDEALRRAKITYIENSDDTKAHPSMWAAFIALGNNAPIHVPSPLFKWYYTIIIVSLLVIIGYLFYFKKRKIAHF